MTDTSYLYKYFMEKSQNDQETEDKSAQVAQQIKLSVEEKEDN